MKYKMAILLSLLIIKSGLSRNNDMYSNSFGNLTFKISTSGDDYLKDEIFRYVEYSSLITNNLLPNHKVYLEINTFNLRNENDFLISCGDGQLEYYEYVYPYINGIRTLTKTNQKITKLDSNQLVIRYVCQKPDFDKLLRTIYYSIINIEKIKENQLDIEYKWMASYWKTKSIEPNTTKEWSNLSVKDTFIQSFIKTHNFESKMCYRHTKFGFYYCDSQQGIKLYEKQNNKFTGFKFDSLSWFAINKTYGIFATTDSCFYIVDSKNKKISEKFTMPVAISKFQQHIFTVESKFGIRLSLINTDNIGIVKDKYSLIYRPVENLFIDVTKTNEKDVKKFCMKKYWH